MSKAPDHKPGEKPHAPTPEQTAPPPKEPAAPVDANPDATEPDPGRAHRD